MFLELTSVRIFLQQINNRTIIFTLIREKRKKAMSDEKKINRHDDFINDYYLGNL